MGTQRGKEVEFRSSLSLCFLCVVVSVRLLVFFFFSFLSLFFRISSVLVRTQCMLPFLLLLLLLLIHPIRPYHTHHQLLITSFTSSLIRPPHHTLESYDYPHIHYHYPRNIEHSTCMHDRSSNSVAYILYILAVLVIPHTHTHTASFTNDHPIITHSIVMLAWNSMFFFFLRHIYRLIECFYADRYLHLISSHLDYYSYQLSPIRLSFPTFNKAS